MISLSLQLCRGLRAIKEEHTQASGLLSGCLVAVHSVTLCEKLWTLSHGYLSASQGVRLQLYRKVFFICLVISAQAYLGHSELVYFSYLWASQVAHPLDPLEPGIRAARTTIFHANWCMQDKSWLWWAHQSIQCPQERAHFLASLGGLEAQFYTGLGWTTAIVGEIGHWSWWHWVEMAVTTLGLLTPTSWHPPGWLWGSPLP